MKLIMQFSPVSCYFLPRRCQCYLVPLHDHMNCGNKLIIHTEVQDFQIHCDSRWVGGRLYCHNLCCVLNLLCCSFVFLMSSYFQFNFIPSVFSVSPFPCLD